MAVKLHIKEMREKFLEKDKRYTQRYVGDLLGITETNYRRLESGKLKSLSLQAIDTLCLEFNCTPNDLIEVVRE
ncbi:helix-turn-helix domain-containing protein [Brasilonema sp. CT11]|nr:helix-turn-helix domain-containing protein [Brasilonema sp. CT11]